MAVLEFRVVATKRTEVMPGNEVLNIDLDTSYAEFLSMTKHLEGPLTARFEMPDGRSFEHRIGAAKGLRPTADARITMRNWQGELPSGTRVTILDPSAA